MDKFEAEGRAHYRSCGFELQNPYSPGSDAYNSFERGWKNELNLYPQIGEAIEKKKEKAAKADEWPREQKRLEREKIVREAARAFKKAREK